MIRYIFISFSLCFIGCKGTKIMVPQLQPPLPQQEVEIDSKGQNPIADLIENTSVSHTRIIQQMIDTSHILSSGWTGLMVWDLGADSLVMDRYGNKFFTAASNAKLLTLFTCLKTQGDSIIGLRYVETDTSVVFWGSGDPSFLNRKFPQSRTYAFLKEKSKRKQLYYYPQEVDAAYGEGWMWDDYNGGYQPEICALPMYENMTHFDYDRSSGWTQRPIVGITVKKSIKDYTISRTLHANVYEISNAIDSLDYYHQSIPIYDAGHSIVDRLSDTLHAPVKLISYRPTNLPIKTLYSIPTDTILSEMMAQSDNFIAEHMLLSCGNILYDTLSTSWIIDTVLHGLMRHLTPQPKWVDGSGLSRYNLSTPTLNIQILREMYKAYGQKRMFNLMSIGGRRGTLKSLYSDQSLPYVYAKTGTLSNVYNLSGYLVSKSGRILCFSLMNNNFEGPTSRVRSETQRIVKYIHQQF
jgi:serine-type D-Ala-D-Ala carboxypeptidase/endopeptidase (penicillin-binding protein 4)